MLIAFFGELGGTKQCIMKIMEFVKYETPEVEIVEVEVERGFYSSENNIGSDNEGYTPVIGMWD